MLYKLRGDIVADNEGNKRVVFGVDVYELVRSVPAIFTDEQQALAFLDLCNKGQPCYDHLTEIIDDIQSKAAHP